MFEVRKTPGLDGDKYIPFEERSNKPHRPLCKRVERNTFVIASYINHV